MAAVGAVYVFHHTAELLSVGRCVLDAVMPDVVVDHLMDDGILYYFLGQIKIVAYGDTEAVGFITSQQAAALIETAGAQRCPGMAHA